MKKEKKIQAMKIEKKEKEEWKEILLEKIDKKSKTRTKENNGK